MSTQKPLANVTALTFESRMSDSMANLLKRKGADVISAPSMQEVPLENHGAVFDFAEKLLGGEVDILICTTGVGTNMMIETLKARYDLQKISDYLAEIIIVARGPKPTRVLRKFNLPVDIKVPEPNTWKEILRAMAEDERTSDLAGKKVAIQEYGETNKKLNTRIKKQGSQLLRVPIYRWELPDDLDPLKKGIRSIIDGEAQIVLFTSKTQVNHVMKIADKIASGKAVQKAMNEAWVASIGPVCSKGIKSHGIEVDFEPSRPKLGVFINEIAEKQPAEIK